MTDAEYSVGSVENSGNERQEPSTDAVSLRVPGGKNFIGMHGDDIGQGTQFRKHKSDDAAGEPNGGEYEGNLVFKTAVQTVNEKLNFPRTVPGAYAIHPDTVPVHEVPVKGTGFFLLGGENNYGIPQAAELLAYFPSIGRNASFLGRESGRHYQQGFIGAGNVIFTKTFDDGPFFL